MKKIFTLSACLFIIGTAAIAQTASKTPAKPATTTKSNSTTNTGSFKDERDGETYKTAVIDGKTWMIEPLRYKTENCDCIYWEESDKSKGAFYTAAQAQKVIPAGWRIPTIEEYEALLAKTGKTPEGLKKAGFPIELLSFDLTTYQNLQKYKNDDFMKSVMVGDKKAFNVTESTEFLALQITKNKLESGYEYESINEYTLRVSKDAASVLPGPAIGYIRLFLIKA